MKKNVNLFLMISINFEMEAMKDYQNLYLIFDVILLADVFKIFRNHSLKNYGLCSSHYFSTSALTWHGKVIMIKVEF